MKRGAKIYTFLVFLISIAIYVLFSVYFHIIWWMSAFWALIFGEFLYLVAFVGLLINDARKLAKEQHNVKKSKD